MFTSIVVIPELQEKLKELKYEVAIVSKFVQDEQTDPGLVDIFAPFHESAALQVKNIEDKLAEFTKRYTELAKYFGEASSVPSFTFFLTWSQFLNKFEVPVDLGVR